MLRVGEPHKQSGFGQFFLVATWVMEERLVFALIQAPHPVLEASVSIIISGVGLSTVRSKLNILNPPVKITFRA